ncbi:hypothetical protein CLOM_g17016, partial [Closterium sp. NIES-68]
VGEDVVADVVEGAAMVDVVVAEEAEAVAVAKG